MKFFTANSDQVLHDGYIQTAISILPDISGLFATHLVCMKCMNHCYFFHTEGVILNDSLKKLKLSPLCSSVRQ